MNNLCPNDAQQQDPKMVQVLSNRAWKKLGVHKTIAKSDDFQKKKNLCCLRRSQKLQKKLSKIAKVIGTNLQGIFEKGSKMLLISSNRAKTANF